MKPLFAMFLCASFLFIGSAHAVRETGGSPSFEQTIRSTQLGKTVLSAVEESLVATGYVLSGPMQISWENEGQSFRGVLWYRSESSWSTMQIVVTGELGKTLDVTKIEVNKQNP